MGSDRNYLALELSSGADANDVTSTLEADETFDEDVSTVNDTVVAVGRGGDHRPAVERLRSLAEEVSRALVLHVHDTTMTGVGYFYEAHDGDLVLVDRTEGAERYGVDVVDYYRREFDFRGSR